VNGYKQGFRSVASFGFCGQESASKPPQPGTFKATADFFAFGKSWMGW
jgi:hypothetical protein